MNFFFFHESSWSQSLHFKCFPFKVHNVNSTTLITYQSCRKEEKMWIVPSTSVSFFLFSSFASPITEHSVFFSFPNGIQLGQDKETAIDQMGETVSSSRPVFQCQTLSEQHKTLPFKPEDRLPFTGIKTLFYIVTTRRAPISVSFCFGCVHLNLIRRHCGRGWQVVVHAVNHVLNCFLLWFRLNPEKTHFAKTSVINSY